MSIQQEECVESYVRLIICKLKISGKQKLCIQHFSDYVKKNMGRTNSEMKKVKTKLQVQFLY